MKYSYLLICAALVAATAVAPAGERKTTEKTTEQKAAEHKAAEEKAAAERKAAERKAAERKAAEQKAAERKAAERKAAEKKAAEHKTTEPKAAEHKTTEPKTGDRVSIRKDQQAVNQDKQKLASDVAAGDNAAAKQDAAQLAQDRSQRRGDVVDNRQLRQDNRIQNGVKNGSLTPDELTQLQSQQATIQQLEDQFKGDGAISRGEALRLNQALNQASVAIFADKHNTDGVQMPVYRLGQNVKLNADVAAKLDSGTVSAADARTFSHDFARLSELKRVLGSSAGLSDADRAKLQAEYDTLLNKYFTVAPAAAPLN